MLHPRQWLCLAFQKLLRSVLAKVEWEKPPLLSISPSRCLTAGPAGRTRRRGYLRPQRAVDDGLCPAAPRVSAEKSDPAERHPRHQDDLHRLTYRRN